MRTLGQRALDVAQKQLEAGVRETPHGSNTSPIIRQYLKPCVRDVRTESDNRTTTETISLSLYASNWCAAMACFCHREALRPGERPAHGYRAGVIEMVADVRIGDGYCGKWLDISDVRDGLDAPSSGDLAVYDRSVQGRPDTAWWRHVNRIESWGPDAYVAIGGNEKQKVRRALWKIDNPKLLGFLIYPPARSDGLSEAVRSRPMMSEAEKEEILDAVAVSLHGIADSSIWGDR